MSDTLCYYHNVSEVDMKKQFTIRLEPSDIQKLDELAKKQIPECQASSYARYILTEHIKTFSPTQTKEKTRNVEPRKKPKGSKK